MKKLLTSKWFIVLAVSLLLIAGIVLSFIPNSPLKAAVGVSSKVVSPAQKGVKSTGNAFSDFWAAIADGIAIREENKTLKELFISGIPLATMTFTVPPSFREKRMSGSPLSG